MNYYDKSRAVCAIGEALCRKGWTLIGYNEDKSDMMTDYYHPASWDGVATNNLLPGIVVCVGVYGAEKSGQEEIGSRSEKLTDCDRCSGTGIEPGALTYDEARLNPHLQHSNVSASARGAVLLFGSSVVSPLAYLEDGSPRCDKCHGRGHSLKSVDYVRWVWPVFHEVTKGMAWHVEINGKVAFSGKGFAGCERDSYQDHSAADAVASEIEGVARLAIARYGPNGHPGHGPNGHPGHGPNGHPGDGAGTKSWLMAQTAVAATMPVPKAGQLSTLDGITVEQEGDWTWVKFPGVPTEDVREAIKTQYGARFSGKRKAWYIRQTVDLDAVAETIRKSMPVSQVQHDPVAV